MQSERRTVICHYPDYIPEKPKRDIEEIEKQDDEYFEAMKRSYKRNIGEQNFIRYHKKKRKRKRKNKNKESNKV